MRNIFKLKLADLHKYFGVVSFGWALIVGFTGTLLAFNSIIIKVFQKLTLDKLAAKYNTSEALVGETVSFTQILSSIEKLGVNSSVSFVSFPGTEFGVSGRFVLLMESMWLGRAQASEVLVLGASGGNVQQVVDLPFYLKALVLSQPLHFGDFGGWPLKILWVAFTLMTLSTLLLGVGSYFSKRKLQQRNEKLIPIRKSIKVPPVYRLPFFLTASCLFGVLGCLLFQKVLFAVSLAALALPALVFLVKVRTRA